MVYDATLNVKKRFGCFEKVGRYLATTEAIAIWHQICFRCHYDEISWQCTASAFSEPTIGDNRSYSYMFLLDRVI